MNTNILGQAFGQVFGQLQRRTMIVVALIAFAIGTLFGGSGGGNGRYVPVGGTDGVLPITMMDTKTGDLWIEDPAHSGKYKRQASLSYF